eukprot:maker-scaffold79_size400133-snap-gene-3.16 protein:Tk03965 transcript:maker-scaffold79_size400133-snap-gene-3.16-mRNA-1 annotation:"iron zinc purple acid phosphatase-like protein"
MVFVLLPLGSDVYRVGSNLGWSSLFWFQTLGKGSDWSPRIAIFGDMGNENAQSIPRLQREAQDGMYNMILHIGDMAYNMDDDNARVGDEFMRQIEPIAAYVPYMTSPGNHEQMYNFSNYKARFTMPGNAESMFYSFNVGPVHFISISTEFYYFLNYGLKMVANQYRWLVQDLRVANQPDNRGQQPWIVMLGHRPMYCSTADKDDCTKQNARTRTGLPFLKMFGLEKLLLEYNVDMAIWAHEHDYERFWPLYNNQVLNGSLEQPYTNPRAPVHIITGSAGCTEKHDPFGPKPDITAFRTLDYGYSLAKTSLLHLFFLACLVVADPISYYEPEQIHLSVKEDPSQFIVTWSTWNDTVSLVKYGKEFAELNLLAEGSSSLFVDGGQEKRHQYIHRVTLENLGGPNEVFGYQVGSEQAWSTIFAFRTLRSDPDWSPIIAIFGDMGKDNARSLPRLEQEVQEGMYDLVFHVGDFAYDMEEDNARIGDDFMNEIESIAAYVPYMTCPGNHDEAYNFSNYKARFSMPGDAESMYYSFNLGPVHFISISTEFYFFLEYGTEMVANQFEWLVQDLKDANQPENRAERPWIIVIAHRPMYCSNSITDDDCIFVDSRIRVGLELGTDYVFGLEQLFFHNNVDLYLAGHQHSYERMFPILNYTTVNGPDEEEPFTNPKAPVHLTTGAAGNEGGQAPFDNQQPARTVFRTEDYGYARLYAHNGTHLEIEQVSVDLASFSAKDGAVVDQFWLINDSHQFPPASSLA